MSAKRIAFAFWLLALSCLGIGLIFGFAGSLQYIMPGFLKDKLGFAQMRPLHVFLITQWISCAAVGSMYYFLPAVSNRKLASPLLAQVHLLLQVLVVAVAVSDFFLGRFSGREYMEFPAWLAGIMILGWAFALTNYFATLRPSFNRAPVYVWSWATGMLFFIITISEACLWQFDHFNTNIIRDITIQWKALGSMVGAWNMLVYGGAMYVMCRISGSDKVARSKEAFFFYFLGLTNLMFNWGHHTYVVPASPLIRTTAYLISMTELLIFFDLVWKWQKTLTAEQKLEHFSVRLLKSADGWILLNLALAISISVPALNQFTHGTHITVAHAMGATIGINTTILLAVGYFILWKEQRMDVLKQPSGSVFRMGLFNVSLLVFWISLIGSGISKSAAAAHHDNFAAMMLVLRPWFRIFSFSGFILTIAIVLLSWPLIKRFIRNRKEEQPAMTTEVSETVAIIFTEEELV